MKIADLRGASGHIEKTGSDRIGATAWNVIPPPTPTTAEDLPNRKMLQPAGAFAPGCFTCLVSMAEALTVSFAARFLARCPAVLCAPVA